LRPAWATDNKTISEIKQTKEREKAMWFIESAGSGFKPWSHI
jgi:hypothetical protein